MTFRPLRTRAVLVGVGTAVLAAFTAVAFALPEPWTDRLTMSAAGAVVLAGCLLLARPKVVADETGVTVVNLVRRRRLAWPEVLGVQLRPGDPWVYLDLADGTSMAAMGIQPGNGTRRAVADARRLRELAESRGTAAGSPG